MIDPTTSGTARRGDVFPFLRAWLANPLRVAAVAPSSPGLAALMTRDLGEATGPVLELGPGTGAFTRALLGRGVAEDRLTLVELDDRFASMLALRFPRARLLRADASGLAPLLAGDVELFGAVVSGLPLLSMPADKVTAILGTAFSRLRSDGAFFQFTYGVRCPVSRPILEGLDLTSVRTGTIFRNMPPAGVYRITRRPEG